MNLPSKIGSQLENDFYLIRKESVNKLIQFQNNHIQRHLYLPSEDASELDQLKLNEEPLFQDGVNENVENVFSNDELSDPTLKSPSNYISYKLTLKENKNQNIKIQTVINTMIDNTYQNEDTLSKKALRSSKVFGNSIHSITKICEFLDDDSELSDFGDEKDASIKKFIQMNEDEFPILVHNSESPGLLSATTAGLDLANCSKVSDKSFVNINPRYTRTRSQSNFETSSTTFNYFNTFMPKENSLNNSTNYNDKMCINDGAPLGVCRYFYHGFCFKGDKCSYSHVIPSNVQTHTITSSIPISKEYPPMISTEPYIHGVKSNKKGQFNDPSFYNKKLEEFLGQIQILSVDQYGCRYLQKKIEEHYPNAIEIILNEILEHFNELMINPFGNYLCQKIIEFCSQEQRLKLTVKISSDILIICFNLHGTRALQKLIEHLSDEDSIKLFTDSIKNHVVELIKDLNGNHVIQKCLNKFDPTFNQFIFDSIGDSCKQVATHRHGCCVLQRCIDFSTEEQRDKLVKTINKNGFFLVQDAFGNYVVQYVLDIGNSKYTSDLISYFKGYIFKLSIQKFSSNVIEKCIRVADYEVRKTIIDEILDTKVLENLIKDSYANYVVQTSLEYAAPSQRALLIGFIKPLLPSIQYTSYGKRVISKIYRDLTDCKVDFPDSNFCDVKLIKKDQSQVN